MSGVCIVLTDLNHVDVVVVTVTGIFNIIIIIVIISSESFMSLICVKKVDNFR